MLTAQDYAHMDFSNVKGLNCNTCGISSCETSHMKTPVSALDAHLKSTDMSCLEKLDRTISPSMYWIKKTPHGKCVFFDDVEKRCKLPLEKRFNSCLLFPVRVYSSNNKIKLILSTKCPSSLKLFDLVARRDKAVCNYIRVAGKIFILDDDYRRHVLEKTKDFDKILLIGNLDEWR